MKRLTHLSMDDLRQALETVTEKKPALRLVVAINYKQGMSQTEIADAYGLARKTVYNWLERLDADPLDEAIYDKSPPGRPRKLSERELAHLSNVLQHPPSEVGIHGDEWTPDRLGTYVTETMGVDYAASSLGRILRECRRRP